MSSDPTQKNKPVLPNETRPSQGGSGGSDSQMNTPGPRLTTGEPERPVLTDKSKVASKPGEPVKAADGKQGTEAPRTGGQPRGDESQKGMHGDAGRSFPDTRPNTGGSNPAQQQGKQGQPNPQSPMPAPKEGSTGSTSEHAGGDKQRDQKSGNVK